MRTNLFFEGPVRTGKSTILRHALLPYLPDLGGFVVQRLLDPDGVPIAYRLMGMEEIRRAGCDSETRFLSVDAPYPQPEDEALSNIFLWSSPRRFDATVFETFGVECLQSSTNKVILLDEIGGVDLLCPGFLDALRTVLRSATPCIGILKELEKARDARSFNQELRALLFIHPLTSENLSEVPATIQTFLDGQNI